MLDIHEILNNIKVETNYERAIFKALGIIRERALFYEAEHDFARALAYMSAADILAYAMEENWECMNQFDYYDKEVIEDVD